MRRWQKEWTCIGKLSEGSKKDSASYKSYEKEIDIGKSKFRAVVIHSDYYGQRKKKSIDKKIVKDLESAGAVVKKLTSVQYYCIKDARMAAEKVKPPRYHKLEITVEEKKIYKKGRPKGGIKEV